MEVFPKIGDELVVARGAAEQVFRAFVRVPVSAVWGHLHAADWIGQGKTALSECVFFGNGACIVDIVSFSTSWLHWDSAEIVARLR